MMMMMPTWSLGSPFKKTPESEDDRSLVLLHHLAHRIMLWWFLLFLRSNICQHCQNHPFSYSCTALHTVIITSYKMRLRQFCHKYKRLASYIGKKDDTLRPKDSKQNRFNLWALRLVKDSESRLHRWFLVAPLFSGQEVLIGRSLRLWQDWFDSTSTFENRYI